MTLTEFLLARIEEDEQMARGEHSSGWSRAYLEYKQGDYENTKRLPAPRRLIEDCEAKRRIVEWLSEREQVWVGTLSSDPDAPRTEDFVTGSRVANPAEAYTLRLLALPYADHPDYDEAWRP